MLYKFKAKNAADVIMLEPNGRQILQLIGKSTDGKGIITAAEMAGAIDALTAAIAQDEQASKPPEDGDAQEDEVRNAVSLRQRATPLLDLMRRSQKDGTDITWGV
jgi:cyclopropane-fatty-acyl-phospholipid synthase